LPAIITRHQGVLSHIYSFKLIICSFERVLGADYGHKFKIINE